MLHLEIDIDKFLKVSLSAKSRHRPYYRIWVITHYSNGCSILPRGRGRGCGRRKLLSNNFKTKIFKI